MTTAVSAPGKVLLAGGYLVLDQKHTGLVFGLSARIHILVSEESSGEQIVVRSPQFEDATWIYKYLILDKKRGVEVSQITDGVSGHSSPNHFIETTLIYVLTYIVESSGFGSKIAPFQVTILADTDYYSNSPQPSQVYPQFPSFNVPLSSSHKTGLGSSAALVTALTAAVLIHHMPNFVLSYPTCRSKLHNLAQAAHCAAQGKVGSGFDIAAAVYGACIYRRFSPSILASVGEPGTADYAVRVKNVVDDKDGAWDHKIYKQDISIPHDWALVMCDVDCGSATVSMVKKVLEWRANNPDTAASIWEELQHLQKDLVTQIRLADVHTTRLALEKIRHQIRQMSNMSGVPIEPAEQTELIDAVNANIEDVIGGVVPGAGGYDAIVLLVKYNKKVIGELTAFLETWGAQKNGSFKLLNAGGTLEGTKIEEYKNYTDCAAV